MKLQQLLSFTRKAVDEYQMIETGDKIAVGISGGKDSLTLLYALSGLRRFYPKPFELTAVTVDLGYEKFHTEKIDALCRELGVPYHVIKTDIAHILFEERKEAIHALCVPRCEKALSMKRPRRWDATRLPMLITDDVIETMMMSLFYEGRFHSFSPLTYLDRMDLTVIRPMIFVTEADVIGFRNKYRIIP